MAKVISEWKKTLLAADFTASGATVAVNSSVFTDIATMKVGAKQRVFFGNGAINLGVDDRGTLKLQAKDGAAADIPGVFRLALRDANGINQQFIREDTSGDTTTGVRMGKGGKTGNEAALAAGQDSYLVLQFKSTAASATATYANCTVNVPATVQALAE